MSDLTGRVTAISLGNCDLKIKKKKRKATTISKLKYIDEHSKMRVFKQ